MSTSLPLRDLRERALAPVTVAIPDSGIDASHPDLAGRVIAAYDVDPITAEITRVERPAGARADPLGHGTAVASIVASIAPNARLVDLRVLGADARAPGAGLVAATRFAIAEGHPVINLSLSASPRFERVLFELCERAYRNGQIVVAARRNIPLFDEGYPAALTSTIAVDAGPAGSPYEPGYRPGAVAEFIAPGEDVCVALPGGGHALRAGTSYAAPAIAGLCALILGAFPDARPFDVKSMLRTKCFQRDSPLGNIS